MAIDAGTYQAIRASWVTEKDEARATVKRLTAQIRDLDRTWKRIQPGSESRNEPVPPPPPLRNGTLSAKVSDAVQDLPVDFDSPEVWKAVLDANPGTLDDQNFRANVANALKRLVELGTIELVQRGQGRAPARYRRVQLIEDAMEDPAGNTM